MTNATQLPNYIIKIQGKNCPDTISLLSLNIISYTNKNSSATLCINPGNMPLSAKMEALEQLFAEGTTIEILIGYGDNLLSNFSGHVVARSFWSDLSAHYLNILCSGTDPAGNETESGENKPVKAVVNASYGENVLSIQINNTGTVDGKLLMPGNNLLKPKAIIALDGLSNTFNGNYFIEEVEQSMENGDWTSLVKFNSVAV